MIDVTLGLFITPNALHFRISGINCFSIPSRLAIRFRLSCFMKATKAKCTWVNVMETLVTEEVERQFRKFSTRQQSFIAMDAVTTYALNRLKPLYANSQKGYEWQAQRAREEFGSNIEMAVRQGIAAVERDPLRASEPIRVKADDQAGQALQAMKKILQRKDLDWDNLPDVLEEALNGASNGEITWQPRKANSATRRRLDWTRGGEIRSRP